MPAESEMGIMGEWCEPRGKARRVAGVVEQDDRERARAQAVDRAQSSGRGGGWQGRIRRERPPIGWANGG